MLYRQSSFLKYRQWLACNLHNDPSVFTVIISDVPCGSKDENPERTGFAHFFEHLLFEGTENIKRGEWFKIVTGNGGVNNANTTDDRTYYYEVFLQII
jgi:predicted Zn-dependent peptidase